MTRRKVRLSREREMAQSALELPPEPVVKGSLALAVAAAPEPNLPAHSPSSCSPKGLPPLTKAQVHYWQELCGELTLAGGVGLPTAKAFPPALRPNRATLTAMMEYGILARRHRAWHLTRLWYTRLSALRAEAVDTRPLRPCERPAPGLPSYAELQAWEAICR